VASQLPLRAAFDRPGGESCSPARARPIDLQHLSRQTMGDRDIEREVLALFVQQALTAREEIGGAAVRERLRLAHALKGSARGVGAFRIADCLVELEDRPDDADVLKRLAVLIDEVRGFIAAINR
jgi:HPt (histidine-containing phosphotransfer) domain-containing protein